MISRFINWLFIVIIITSCLCAIDIIKSLATPMSRGDLAVVESLEPRCSFCDRKAEYFCLKNDIGMVSDYCTSHFKKERRHILGPDW